MRILYKPKVYLVGRPAVAEEGFQAFLNDNGLQWPTPTEGVVDAARLIEMAGRNCYMSYGKKAGSKTNEAYIRNLLGRNTDGSFKPGPAHGSVTEHPHWQFAITGAGRGYSHEVVRHRVGVGYSQLSTRYCDFEREEEEGTWEPGFCVPALGQLSDEAKARFEAKFQADQAWYTETLHIIERDLENDAGFQAKLESLPARERARTLRKAARGATRDGLPIGTEAIMFFTANARALWNMAVLRASEFAEAQIRDVFVQTVKIMEVELPPLFNHIVYKQVWDGSQSVEMPRDKL